MKRTNITIVYAMIKKSGKEDEGRITLPLTEQFIYRTLKEAVNKEELLVYSLVDILARMRGYTAGRFIRYEEGDDYPSATASGSSPDKGSRGAGEEDSS